MDDNASLNPDRATGSLSREQWLEIGSLQFTDLRARGFQRTHSLLEIGCGNLRAGWRIIRYLDPHLYVGVDVSPVILLAAIQTIVEFDLQEKHPRLFLIEDNDLEFLPKANFDIVHAHSVFTHVPPEIVSQILGGVARVMKADGRFFATFFEADGQPSGSGFLNEDFYYSFEHLVNLGRPQGLIGYAVEGWNYTQQKIEFRHA